MAFLVVLDKIWGYCEFVLKIIYTLSDSFKLNFYNKYLIN
jgi:hypothetical protein